MSDKMGSKVNKRTLKKRVRKVLSICIFLTVMLFGVVMVYLAMLLSKTEAMFLCDYMSSSIAQEMNSEFFLKTMGINGLQEFNLEDAKSIEWVENIRKNEELNLSGRMVINHEDIHAIPVHNQDGNSPDKARKAESFFNLRNMVYTRIELNNKIIYMNRKYSESYTSTVPDAGDRSAAGVWNQLKGKLFNYYSDTRVSYQLLDSAGAPAGSVTTMINTEFVLYIVLGLAAGILFTGLLSLIVANFISKFLTIPVILPLSELNSKFKAVAEDDFVDGIDRQIVLKRPLKEIETLIASTNLIMHKMREYSKMLSDQRQTLISQNEELEAQNEELIESRREIDKQRDLLEAQNEELEAQNEQLAESKRQIEEAQTLLVQNENMASIGQLTAAITHEINTPLGAVNSNVQMCDMMTDMLLKNESVRSNDELKDILEQIKEAGNISIMACKRVAEIIKSLKTFSKLDQAEFQEADIIDGIKSVLILTSNLWKRRISIHEEYGIIPMVKCFPGLLNQVFMNIIVNAIQAIENTGDIFIKVYSDTSNVYVSIKDNGMGVSEENMSRIFEPRFSTKGSGIGMGLGLSICDNIIKRHNGEIKVYSEPGKGAEFIVCIPVNV